MVVLDKDDYINKPQDLLTRGTYRPLATDLTNKYKNKSINKLRPSRHR